MQPITTTQECNAAAQAIGNSDTTAKDTINSPRPDGCYEKDGNLWLSLNELNEGKGADSARHPICKTQG